MRPDLPGGCDPVFFIDGSEETTNTAAAGLGPQPHGQHHHAIEGQIWRILDDFHAPLPGNICATEHAWSHAESCHVGHHRSSTPKLLHADSHPLQVALQRHPSSLLQPRGVLEFKHNAMWNQRQMVDCRVSWELCMKGTETWRMYVLFRIYCLKVTAGNLTFWSRILGSFLPLDECFEHR